MNRINIITGTFVGIISMLSILACSGSKKISEKAHTKQEQTSGTDTLLYVVRAGCFGHCPIDKTVVFSDGKVWYKGVKNVEHLGQFETKISKKKIAALVKEIERAEFFSLEKRYPVNPLDVIEDLPIFTTEVHLNGKKHRVINRQDAPNTLIRLEKFIKHLISDLKFDTKKSKK